MQTIHFSLCFFRVCRLSNEAIGYQLLYLFLQDLIHLKVEGFSLLSMQGNFRINLKMVVVDLGSMFTMS